MFKDFNKAYRTKDNFIERGMKDLTGIINEHLKVENRFTYKKPKNLTDEGDEIPESEGNTKLFGAHSEEQHQEAD